MLEGAVLPPRPLLLLLLALLLEAPPLLLPFLPIPGNWRVLLGGRVPTDAPFGAGGGAVHLVHGPVAVLA